MRKKIKVLTKTAANNAHFKRRIFERYKIIINLKMRKEIICLIQENKAEFIKRKSRARSIFKVIYQDREVLVVYDANHNNLVTALPNKNKAILPLDKTII